MSTPNAGNTASPAPPNLGYPFISNPSPQAGGGGMNFQPQQYMAYNDMSAASPIPGASGGQGDPGPSSMAQQQQQGQFRPQFQQGGLTPQQMAMLQQFSQAAQNQGSQGQVQGQGQPRQFTPQQMQMAMASMQAQQGGNVNPQALMAAMRATQQGQQQQQPQQGQQQQQQRPPIQQMNGFGNAPQQGAPSGQQNVNPAQVAYQQQQRIQQMMQNRPNPGSPVRPHQQPNSMPPPPVPNTQQQQHSQQQQQPSQQGNFTPQQNVGVPQQMGNNSQGGFHLTQQQRDFLTNQRNALFSNPQFLAMPPQQQQAVIMSQQQQILRNMTAGQMPQVGQQPNQQQQQPQQQYQQPQQAQTPTGRPGSAHGTPGSGQSPSIPRQPTPQQMGTPQAQQVQTPQSSHVQTPQQPLSSLPQHMAPPRPASAASQRAPSPHQGLSGMPGSPATMQQPSSTPPPSNAMFPSSGQQMVNAPSPTPSNVSHHSVHQTPAQSHMQPPLHSVSPVHARSQTPSQSQQMGTPQSAQSMNQIGINGQFQGNQQSQLQHQPQQQSMGTPQQPSQPYPQAYSGANQAGPSSSPAQQGAFPVQPIVPTLQNLTPAQQQQMASAMSFMSQAAQAQQSPMPGAGQQQVRPNQQAQGMTPRPPAGIHVPNINTSDFPFDPRLLPHIQHVNDEKWRSSVNPQLVAAVQSAAAIVPTLRHDIIQRMQNVLFHTARIHAAQGIRPPAPGQLPQQGDQAGLPGFSPTAGQAGTPGAIPANQQQRIWQAQQAAQAQGSPVSANSGSPAIRPPPPHLPPASNMPGSPSPRISSLDRRSSGSGKDKLVKGEKTPQQASMPPPNYIPSHTAGPSRTSAHAPAEASIPPPLPSAVSQAGQPQNIKVTAQGLPVKEWESALRVDLPITNITALPVNDIEESEDPTFKGALPPMSEFEKIQVARWLEKDKAFVENEKEQHPKRMAKMKRWAEENDKSTPWWMLRKGEMRAKPQQRLRILWPSEKEKDRMNRTHRNRKVIKFSPAQVKSMAEVEDHIVPVRLDLEHDSFKLKDTFMWNVSDKVVTPEIFAQCLCDDFQVPYQHFQSRIVAAIQERVQEYQSHVLPIVQRRSKEDNRGKLDPEGDADSKAMVEIFRRIREGSGIEEEIRTDPGEEHNDDVKIVSFGGVDAHEDEETLVNVDGDEGESEIKKEMVDEDRPMTVEEAMQCLPKEETEELRILIKIDIIVGTQNLSDSFEWDLNSSVTPEEFSASYVTELGLSKEFATALAHDIHEQILVHKRSLFLTGHAFGSGLVLDDELRLAFLPPVTTSLRKEDVAMSSYTPIFNELREDQLALLESQREKESKRKKRAGRARRGVVLPDRDPIKTQRSLLNPLGSNGLPVFSAPELIANTKDSAPMHRRRGAAIAAEANMALIAQDLPITGPPSPAHTNHYHGPTISARGKRIGRPPKNLSRGSPASFSTGREGSMMPDSSQSQMLATPQLSHIGIGIKRSFREDSIDDLSGVANGSPAISRKRRIADSPPSPEFDHTPVKQDLHPIQEEKKVMEHMGWHCRNCGIPENLSNGKGKDKTGAKVLCGDCSRYLFRTGKPRPCEFTTDESYHLSLKHKNEQSRRSSLSQRARSPSSSTPTATATAPTTGFNSPLKPDSNSNSNSESDSDSSSEDESDSTFASSSRGPKKEKSGRGRGRGKKEVVDTTPVKPPASAPVQTQVGRSPTVGISPSSGKKVIEMPTWASRALAEMRSKYPRDDFVVVQKPRPQGMDVSGPVEWRAKCMDCPGKIYSLGPGETLQNFEVHLKNRAHIANRLNREGKTH